MITTTPSTSSTRYGRPERSWSTSAIPPISAASVIALTSCPATSATRPVEKPSRSRTASKTAFSETAATRPHISAYVTIPPTPITTAQSS